MLYSTTEKAITKTGGEKFAVTYMTHNSRVYVPVICCLTEGFSVHKEGWKGSHWGDIMIAVFRGVQSFYWVKHHWESSCIMTGVHQNILEKTHHVSIFNITSFWGMGKNGLLKLFTMENYIERYLIFKIWLICVVLRCTFVQKGETYSFTFLKFMLKIDCLLNKT